METKNKFVAITIVSVLIGAVISQYIHDKDMDGIPNDKDEFPNNSDEWEDFDSDGIGDNEDYDDDNDGYNDTDDHFPKNSTEYIDTDLDGVGDNTDLDDDDDGYLDEVDIDPKNDLALRFVFDWVELLDKQNSKNSVPFVFFLYRGTEQLHRFDDNDRPWMVPWQQKYNLSVDFELNVPDDKIEQNFTIIAMFYKFRNPEEFDISGTNSNYSAEVIYNLSSQTWNGGEQKTLNGDDDNLDEENDAELHLDIERYNFGFLKSYNWLFNAKEYQISHNFDPSRYAFYSNQPHGVKEYRDYMNFITLEEKDVTAIGAKLKNISKEKEFDTLTEINFFLSFVQSLKYAEDNISAGYGEYPKYPIETLLEQSGDCEDSSALLISLIEPLGYEAALILIPEAWEGYGHAAVGVNMTGASGRYYIVNQGEENEMGYYYAETTALGWKLGEMPDLNSYKAYVYEA